MFYIKCYHINKYIRANDNLGNILKIHTKDQGGEPFYIDNSCKLIAKINISMEECTKKKKKQVIHKINRHKIYEKSFKKTCEQTEK